MVVKVRREVILSETLAGECLGSSQNVIHDTATSMPDGK